MEDVAVQEKNGTEEEVYNILFSTYAKFKIDGCAKFERGLG